MDHIDRYHKSYADLRDKVLQGNIGSDGRDDGREDGSDNSKGEHSEVGARAEAEAEAERGGNASNESKRDLQEEGSTKVNIQGAEENGLDETIDQFREMEKEDLEEDTQREKGDSSSHGFNSDTNNRTEQSTHPAVAESESGSHFIISKEERQLEVDLLKKLLAKTVSFEVEARQMLLDSMEKSVERTILLADRNGECYLSYSVLRFLSDGLHIKL